MVVNNYHKLTNVCNAFATEHIYFLGDLFHSTLNTEWSLFAYWVAQQKAQITLIIGNHDIIDASKFENLGIKVVNHIAHDNFLFTHHPEEKENTFNFCGHIHPAFKLTGTGKQQIKLPCFAQKKQQLILPAFGYFTGNYYITKEETEAIYLCTTNEVIPLPK